MAIYSFVPPPSEQGASTGSHPSHADIELWATSALQSLQLSPTARATGVRMSIPLDEDAMPKVEAPSKRAAEVDRPRREILRRDSLRRREALLKGKEGSRRRQRWENDHLLHVPNAQAPLPCDWEVHPTYPVHHVPYYLAPLWEAGVRTRADEVVSARKAEAAKRAGRGEHGKAHIPQELRKKMKKSKGAKSLLMDLEEEVRTFVKDWERALGEEKTEDKGQVNRVETDMDSEDEEIVFVGRNGQMSDEERTSPTTAAKQKTMKEMEKMVYGAPADEKGATFGRWLVHSIADYYGLTSRSVTVGDPARREAYVGIKGSVFREPASASLLQLPRPLWGMV